MHFACKYGIFFIVFLARLQAVCTMKIGYIFYADILSFQNHRTFIINHQYRETHYKSFFLLTFSIISLKDGLCIMYPATLHTGVVAGYLTGNDD